MQIETTEQLKQEFSLTLSRLSHEIRNPISLINSELQLMASSHPELCSYSQWDSLIDNLEYVKELLNELSDFSHAGTVNLIPTDSRKFLESVLSCEKNTLHYLGITLETHLENISTSILLDRVKMRQVLFNLIRNACEAVSLPDGKISVRLFQADENICISVEDNGCGMSREVLSRVKEPFFTTKNNGTGLGITISHEVIQGHKGIIKYTSKENVGTKVEIILPLENEK